MSAKGISEEDAELLLRGLPAGHGPLSDLLAAVAVPGTAKELAGEEAAVATFRSALDGQVVVLGRTSSTRGTRRARAVTAKAVGLAMAVTAVCGGVAIAANSSGRPQPIVVPSVTTPPPVSPTAQPTLPPMRQQPLRQKQAPSTTPKKKKQPTALADVCRAFFGRDVGTGDLERLIEAAGGRKKVLSFCYTLLGGKQSSWTGSPEDDERLKRWIDRNKEQWEKHFPPN